MHEVISEQHLRAELARRHHLDFIKFMWQRPDPFIEGVHNIETCEAIDKAIEKYKNGISSFMLVKIPFRHGKSDIGSRYLPANFIGKFPDDEVIVTAYAYPLVRSFSRFCRDRVMQDPKYQLVYPGVFLAEKNRGADTWGIEGKLGTTSWMGIGGSVTGRGGNLITIDDFCKGRLEAESEVYRETAWESIANDVLTRRAPVCIVIILATPWHVDDIFGRIESKQKEIPEFPNFDEIKFQAFSENYPYGILFPERFNLLWYQSQRAILGPYATAGLLQCDPIARGGNVFEVDKIKYYDSPPDNIHWVRGWDLAYTEKQRVSEDPDYTVGAKVGVRWVIIGDGERIPQIYVDDIIRGRWAAPMRDKIIKSTTIADGPGVQVSVERYGPQKGAYDEVSKALFGLRVVRGSQMPGDKVSKAAPLEGPMAAGNFFVRKASWNEDLIKEFRETPGSKHDDIIDSVAIGFDGHDPFEKRVWPQIQGRHIREFDLNWNKAEANKDGSLHYAGMWQKKDLSIWCVLGLWDAHKGFLFLYDAFQCENSTPSEVIPKLIYHMRLRSYRHEAIVCNGLMWEQKGFSKNTALQYKNEFIKQGVPGKIKEALTYDEFASIIEVGQLFDIDMVYIDSRLNDLILQLFGWVTVDRGRHTGKRPDEENDGYCRALCILVSELRRRSQWIKVMRPKLHDYNITSKVQEVYRKAEKIATKQTVPDSKDNLIR